MKKNKAYISGFLTVIFLNIFLLSCAGPKATTVGYLQVLDSYQGEHIDSLVYNWGPPKGKHAYADGRKEYVFHREFKEKSNLGFYPKLNLSFGSSSHNSRVGVGGVLAPSESSSHYSFCETRVITDKKDKILEYNFRGDACRAIPYNNRTY